MAKKSNYEGAEEYIPDDPDLDELPEAGAGCQGCDLHENADQFVRGVGPPDADLMLVGESPGANEDREGRPFVGNAGRRLDSILEQVGLNRDQIYITNAVRHIRRVDGDIKTPKVTQIRACRPWLATEIQLVSPQYLVAMGTVSARSLLHESASIGETRGEIIESPHGDLVVTYHPSATFHDPSYRDRIAEDLQIAAGAIG